MIFAVINTMNAVDCIGRVMTTHRTLEAAKGSDMAIQSATRKGCGQNSYLPTVIKELNRRVGKGGFVVEQDIVREN